MNSELRTVTCAVPQGSVLGPLFFLLYIKDLYKSIGLESVRLYADDTAIITSNVNLDIVQQQAREMFTKLYHWCVANKLSINNDKTKFVLFHMKNKPVPKHFECIQTDVMQINRVDSIQYLGMLLGEHLYSHEHVDQICASLVKHYGIFNHIKKLFRCEYQNSSITLLFSNTERYRSVWIMHKINHVKVANYAK